MIKYVRTVCTAMVVVCTACGSGAVTDLSTQPPPTDTTKPPVGVQRASITVQVSVDPADAALAQQAGIGVSGLTVRLSSSRPGDPVRTATSGADGMVRFDNLLEGIYQTSTDRTLSANELARLSPADREASVFAGGAQVVLSPPANANATVPLVAARRGSVVISEIYGSMGPLQFTGPNYVYGAYLGLYNNADTTSYLDGMLMVVTSPSWTSDLGDFGDCTDSPNRYRLDSTAIYAVSVQAFPGSGRDYPILPGEEMIVAVDAINHQAAAPEKMQQDLSRAQFEQYYTDGDVDNPESVNVSRVWGSSTGIFGRGIWYYGGGMQYALMAPGARGAATVVGLSAMTFAGIQTFEYFRLPSEYLLDLVAIDYDPDRQFGSGSPTPSCVPFTAPQFDRGATLLGNPDLPTSITRKGLGFTAEGREILQRTKNSERDFHRAVPLRRSLNK